MNLEEMRRLDAVKTYKELEEAKQHIKRLEDAGDAIMAEPCEYTFEKWIQAKEAKP